MSGFILGETNTAPTVANVTASTSYWLGADITLSGSDAENDLLTYTITYLPENISFLAYDGNDIRPIHVNDTLTSSDRFGVGYVQDGAEGIHSISYVASDGGLTSQEGRVDLIVNTTYGYVYDPNKDAGVWGRQFDASIVLDSPDVFNAIDRRTFSGFKDIIARDTGSWNIYKGKSLFDKKRIGNVVLLERHGYFFDYLTILLQIHKSKKELSN